KGDTLNEVNETFFVNLSGAVNATIADSQGMGTIIDNDPVPSLSIGDVQIAEGNSGTTTAISTVTLSTASGQTVTVNWTTGDGTATVADNDFQTGSGTLTFAPGVLTQTISTLVNGDTFNEGNETYLVQL